MKTFIATGLIFIISILLTTESIAQHYHRSGRNNYRGNHYSYRSYNSYYRPARISVGVSLPFGAVMLHVGRNPYYYHQGIFYQPWTNGYIVAPPPVGIIVPGLPGSSVLVIRGSRRYYYYSGTYYMPLAGENRGYQVVDPPEDNSEAIPDKETSVAYEKIVIEGKTYYKKDEVYYKAVVSDNGEIKYEEVGQTGN